MEFLSKMDFFQEFINRNKKVLIISGACSLVGITGLSLTALKLYRKFQNLYVPYVISNKHTYRVNVAIGLCYSYASRIGAKLGFGTEAGVFRKIINYVLGRNFVPCTHPYVKIRNALSSNIPVRIYSPITEYELCPAMIYYHGGAYVLNDKIEMYDHFLADLVNALQIVIISVDYRLAPEFPFPIPIDDCYAATTYLLENLHEFDLNIDVSRIILAGDSAGANITTILSNRLAYIYENIPKLQALIYPPTQYFNFQLPSSSHHSNLELPYTRAKYTLWHLGIKDVTKEKEEALLKNIHTLLIRDETVREKLKNYLNVDLIPEEYKKGRSYYDTYEEKKHEIYPEVLDENNVLVKDEKYASIVKNLFNINISPGLADDEILKNQPKTFMIVCEWDSRKDESIIYAERLKRVGVEVDVYYYQYGFHGIITGGSEISMSMRRDLIRFIADYV